MDPIWTNVAVDVQCGMDINKDQVLALLDQGLSDDAVQACIQRLNARIVPAVGNQASQDYQGVGILLEYFVDEGQHALGSGAGARWTQAVISAEVDGDDIGLVFAQGGFDVVGDFGGDGTGIAFICIVGHFARVLTSDKADCVAVLFQDVFQGQTVAIAVTGLETPSDGGSNRHDFEVLVGRRCWV